MNQFQRYAEMMEGIANQEEGKRGGRDRKKGNALQEKDKVNRFEKTLG